MAAASGSPSSYIVDLRQLRSEDLKLLLDEEVVSWKESLDWDFEASAGLVRKFLDMQALSGYSLLLNDKPIGYSYFVCEERKGLIGDLYILKQFATLENESLLLTSILDAMLKTPLVRRIESQRPLHSAARRCLLSRGFLPQLRSGRNRGAHQADKDIRSCRPSP